MGATPSPDTVEARMYASEREENFRWLASLVATTSPMTLSEKDLVDAETVDEISAFGEFAEIAHGSINPEFVWSNRDALTQAGFPLEHYPVMAKERSTRLTQRFQGTVGQLQGYIALRPDHNQIIVAFSGTANAQLALRDTQVWRTQCRVASAGVKGSHRWKVHSGFQAVYEGIKDPALAALRATFEESKDDRPTIVITAHSLGTCVGYFFLLDLLYRQQTEPGFFLPAGTRFIIASFGPPRIGNDAFVRHVHKTFETYQDDHGLESLQEYAVIAHGDGVPAVPPQLWGFARTARCPLYLHHGRLYRIPESQNEHTGFEVQPPPSSSSLHPRGGHNYYNARDMERLQRRMKAILLDHARDPAGDWVRKYEAREGAEDDEWTKKPVGGLRFLSWPLRSQPSPAVEDKGAP